MTDYNPAKDMRKLKQIGVSAGNVSPRWVKLMAAEIRLLNEQIGGVTELQEENDNLKVEVLELAGKLANQSNTVSELMEELADARAETEANKAWTDKGD